MDKVNSLNRDLLRMMREVFNSVEPVQSDLDELADVLEGFALYLVDKGDAERLVGMLRSIGWVVSPPLPVLATPSAEGDASHAGPLEVRKNPNHCGGCFAPESTFRLWRCPECRRDLCVGCLRRSQCTRCIKERPGWDGQGRLRRAPAEEHEEIKVGFTD